MTEFIPDMEVKPLTNEVQHVNIDTSEASPEAGSCDHGDSYGFFKLPPTAQSTVSWPKVVDRRPVEDIPGRWHVAKVRQHHEKAFAWDLHRLHQLTDGAIAYRIPMVQYKVRRPNRSWQVRNVPLFPRRVFICVADDRVELDPNHRTNPKSAILLLSDAAQQRLRRDLSNTEQLILADAARVDPFPFAKVGTNVRVANGPFEGMTGELIYADGGRRKFVILIDCLGQKVSYELEDNVDLEPIE